MEVLLMDIAVEALLRNCIKERRAEGIAVRNDPMTRLLGRDAEEGLYWDPRHPQRTLCLIGATKSESRREAATLLGISMAEARDLEHGFEDWRMADASWDKSSRRKCFWSSTRHMSKQWKQNRQSRNNEFWHKNSGGLHVN